MSNKAEMLIKGGVKSGVDFKGLVPLLGGMPPKKSVEAIDKANMPKNAPASTASSSGTSDN